MMDEEITPHADVLGIFPREQATFPLVDALLLEQNDEWVVQRARCMTLETMAPLSDASMVTLPTMAA